MNAIVNAKIITENGVLTEHAVIFAETIIAVVPQKQIADYAVEKQYDGQNCFVSPGFIDIHIHGCSNADTMDETEDALHIMKQALPSTGVTGFLPTTMTMEFSKIEAALKRIRMVSNVREGAHILGANVEGPFINPNNKGAHDGNYVCAFDYRKIEPYLDVIKLITIAPELAGSRQFIEKCSDNIVVSMGHSNASYEETLAAIDWGASHLTHTCNAMPTLHHRWPGILGAALDSPVTCELIVDNIHVHQAMQRILLKVKGADKLILITDAMRAALLGDGQYDLGGQTVFVSKGEARLSNDVIAGSILTLNKAVYNFMNTTGLPLEKAIQLVTLNPAQRMGLSAYKGSIAVGKDADLVLINKKVDVMATFVGGILEYRSK